MEEVNFKVVQGDTFTIRIAYKNPDGTAIDLTDFTAQMDVRDKPGGKILCASATEENGGIVMGGTTGIIEVEFSHDQTKRFTTPKASYQMKIINTNNDDQVTLTTGYIKVYQAVIR